MILVLFLLAGVLALVVPRIVVGEDVRATGRTFIGAIRSLQGLAATGQKPVKLYVDLDQGTYWALMVEGREEKPPLDASWATPRTFPEGVRLTDVLVGQTKRVSGRIELVLYPNGHMDPAIFHFSDAANMVLAVAIESFTGAIRTSDERIEPTRNQTIPDRVKALLQPAPQAGPLAPSGVKS
jgi:hypothetical protein